MPLTAVAQLTEQQTFTTATPSLTAGALTAFGNVCINTITAANSFTITGTNLTAANVVVGALAGFTYSTTVGGTYTATLNLTQPGGAYSQAIFVKFTPTAVQSYNGNIPVSGGGGTALNVAASGAGVNTTPTVTTAGASAVTQISATLAGTIPSTGCSVITAYGVEYSTTSGFANGTGTAVLSTNLTGVNFSSAVTGLTVNTVYYYRAYATNSGGTVYGSQQTFTTLPAVLGATALTTFGNICVNTPAGPNSFTISSMVVSAADINVSGPTGYSFSLTANGTYTSTLSITHPAGPFSQVVFVMFNPTAVQSYNGNINVTGGGASVTLTVPVSGAGVNTGATVSTGGATNLLKNSATLSGSISSAGCSVVTSYGIEYSSFGGFANGQGKKIPSVNLTGGNFTAEATGLIQNTKYFYKAYAITGSGIAYGAEKTFTTAGLGSGLIIYSNPVTHGGMLNFSISNIQPASYILQIINITGRVVYSREQIVPLNFIDDRFIVPSNFPPGVYIFRLTNTNNSGFSASKSFLLL
ncbi:MAG: T9SS type A sorting domain-containing protein [Ferruginibacter sp.]